MKKNGFTLAEVLITLTIIGVVAVLTLPGLMTNTAEQQSRTAMKKMMNTMTQAASMNGAIEGFDFSGLKKPSGTTVSDAETGSLARLILDRCNVDTAKGFVPQSKTTGVAASFGDAIYFQDGTAIYFSGTDAVTDSTISAPQQDGIMRGFKVIFDTNGKKGPNIVSNCDGKAIGELTDEDDTDNCRDKTQRVIKDQFVMYLRGAYVAPCGAASAWIMDENQFEALTPGGSAQGSAQGSGSGSGTGAGT